MSREANKGWGSLVSEDSTKIESKGPLWHLSEEMVLRTLNRNFSTGLREARPNAELHV